MDSDNGNEIVVIGSANLDLVVEVARVPTVGETVMGGDLREIPGGKGANQAVAAARLGRRVAMVGRLGDDPAGGRLRAALDTAGVDTRSMLSTDGVPTGVALIAVAADGDNAIVVSPGANAHLSGADIEASRDLVSSATVVLAQLEVPLPAVEAAVGRATGTVILNPAPAPDAPLPESLLAHVDILVPNQTELARLAGHRGAVDASTAPALAGALPVTTVVVTLGAAGALVIDRGEATRIPAPRVDPVDTTAAGDAFCAGLADALAGGASVIDAAEWAVRVGAAATLRAGAQPSLPTRDDVDRLLR